eukprot:scaffold289768_cov30-Tisochrysis_lutea.AAC.1
MPLQDTFVVSFTHRHEKRRASSPPSVMSTLPPNWMQSLQAGVQRMIDPNSSKTFRPRRQAKAISRLDRLNTLAQRTLGTGNLQEAVTLPPGEDLNEWLAVKTLDLFNEVNLVYGFVSDFCARLTAARLLLA